jgi:hypothetical protein
VVEILGHALFGGGERGLVASGGNGEEVKVHGERRKLQ